MGLSKIFGVLFKNNTKYIFYGIAILIIIYTCIVSIKTSTQMEQQVEYNKTAAAQLKALGDQISGIDTRVRAIGAEQQRVVGIIDQQQQDRKNEITEKSRNYRERILNGELQFSTSSPDRGASISGGGGIVTAKSERPYRPGTTDGEDARF